MTQTKKRKAVSVEDLDQNIQEMEAELSDHHGQALTWDEVTTTTAEELAAKEGRRRVLSRLIHAAKIKRLELLKSRYEAEHEPLQQKIEETYAAYQEAEEKLRAAQEERDATNGAWNIALAQERNAQVRLGRTENEIADLKGAR